MAMEVKQVIIDAHTKPILCVAYNPYRREIFTGSEDCTIKIWDSDSGKCLNTLIKHRGWVTQLIFCKQIKILLSAGVDGYIIIWNQSGKIIQMIESKSPIYSMALNTRRMQLLVGYHKKIRGFQVKSPDDANVSELLLRPPVVCRDHTDIVSCIVAFEGRFYTAGFDRKLIIYDSAHAGDMNLKAIHIIHNAHAAGISSMIYGKDSDNSWIITGSFDKVVKLWSPDGNYLQRFDQFASPITSLIYINNMQVLWIVANSISVYDPRSGFQVTDHVHSVDLEIGKQKERPYFRSLIISPDTTEIIGITTRRAVVAWRYNANSSLTTLGEAGKVIESIACITELATTEPLLFYTAGAESKITRWERTQLNLFMYNKEDLPYMSETTPAVKPLAITKPSSGTPLIPASPATQKQSFLIEERPTVLKLIYYEGLDLVIAGFEDGQIGLWGYYDSNQKSLSELSPQSRLANNLTGIYSLCRLFNHKEAVTSLAALRWRADNAHYLISSGWDRRICVWNLRPFCIHTTFRNRDLPPDREELAADDIVCDLDYSPERKEFGYASADGCAYIRQFSSNGEDMKLRAVLQGHEADVTLIRWNTVTNKWVTGSNDRTIRIWDETGIPCICVLNNCTPVTALCIDSKNGCIISGGYDKIVRVFDGKQVVQKHTGHIEEIRGIVHLASRNQYISASWDGGIKIWGAYVLNDQTKYSRKGLELTNTLASPFNAKNASKDHEYLDLSAIREKIKKDKDEAELQESISLVEHYLFRTVGTKKSSGI